MTATATTGLGEIDLTDLDRWEEGPPHDWFALLRSEAPVFWSASQSFLRFFAPPLALGVTSTFTFTPRAVARPSSPKISGSLQRNTDRSISRRALRMTSTIVVRRSATEVTTASVRASADESLAVIRAPASQIPRRPI